MGRSGSRDPAFGREFGEIQRVAGPFGELLETERLGAPVALAEGVDVVDVADDLAG